MTHDEAVELLTQLIDSQERAFKLIKHVFLVMHSHSHDANGDVIRHPDIESAIEYKAFIESEGIEMNEVQLDVDAIVEEAQAL